MEDEEDANDGDEEDAKDDDDDDDDDDDAAAAAAAAAEAEADDEGGGGGPFLLVVQGWGVQPAPLLRKVKLKVARLEATFRDYINHIIHSNVKTMVTKTTCQQSPGQKKFPLVPKVGPMASIRMPVAMPLASAYEDHGDHGEVWSDGINHDI